jgi:hypothetical protein
MSGSIGIPEGVAAGAERRSRPEPTFAGTPPFPEAARVALADPQLRANLGRATSTIRTKRAAVVAERTDWEGLRVAGAAIKDEVLRDLPALLEQLERAVTAAGGTVHWARDAAEANAIVAGIAHGVGASEVVKVKSMATQEIELNEALSSVTTCHRTSWCPRSTATGPRSATSSSTRWAGSAGRRRRT